LDEDLKSCGLTKRETDSLSAADFELRSIDKTDAKLCREIKRFIERHEWLGKLPNRPTHRFIAEYAGSIAGAIVMATPNAFSNLLGEEYRNREKLISRGACISWSPKNLASHLIMFAIRWMVHNTEFRIFTAYADPEAKELGTVYQACNFVYLGQTAGSTEMFLDPKHPERGWFSSREFRKISKYKQYARELGIRWAPEWNVGWLIRWDIMGTGIESQIRQAAKDYQARCQVRKVPAKHKYCYLLGRTKTETKQLKRLLAQHSPDRVGLSYPKARGQ
jgi:hypothetical protein